MSQASLRGKKVLIAGGSGLVGTTLCKKLKRLGAKVAILSRDNDSESSHKVFVWDLKRKTIDPKAIKWADYIINLAGAGIADERWTKERKKAILNSRIKTTALLYEQVKKSRKKLKAYISASAIGYYGMEISEKIYKESDKPGKDFLAKVCKRWEQEAKRFSRLKIRTVLVRTAVVLSSHGGALPSLAHPARLCLAAPLGSGKQYVPWIHIDDLCAIYIAALQNPDLRGPYNAAAPEHVTNRQLMRTTAKVLHRPFWPIPVPAFLLRAILGEMAITILGGSRISSAKLEKTGFKFRHPKLRPTLKKLL